MAELLCHPSTPTDIVRAIEVRVSRRGDDTLVLTFQVDGDVSFIDVPPPRTPSLTHQLWEHTCFEAFIAVHDSAAYHELNFSPSGEWAGYAFRAYREIAGVADDALAPRIVVRPGIERLELEASLQLEHLAPAYQRAPLRLGLAAVIEELDGTRSYWSLRHPPGQPDFHHAEALALHLEPVGNE